MKIILVFVSTLDGKVTKWGNPDVTSWSSQEDKTHFRKLWNKARLIVMGSSTYLTETFNPSAKHLLVILTSHPAEYNHAEVPGKIEFSDESPPLLVSRFEKKGYQEMLLVGGPHVATSFLRENLIDELWLTIEPKIFGSGGNFATEEKLDIDLQLISSEKVNDQGTLINRYVVVKK